MHQYWHGASKVFSKSLAHLGPQSGPCTTGQGQCDENTIIDGIFLIGQFLNTANNFINLSGAMYSVAMGPVVR